MTEVEFYYNDDEEKLANKKYVCPRCGFKKLEEMWIDLAYEIVLYECAKCEYQVVE